MRFCAAFFVVLALLPVSLLKARQLATADSSLSYLDKSVYYDITKTRLTRWVRANVATTSQDILQQVVDLLEDAQTFAKQKDYDTAQLFLDTALDMTKTATKVDTIRTESEFEFQDMQENRFEPQIVTGVDLWRQEFELNFIDDTTFYENSGNPYVGLRMRGDMQSKGLGAVTTYLLAKVSRDYYSAEAELQNLKGSYAGDHWLLQNRVEFTSYRDTLGLQYWQYSNRLRGGVELAKNFLGYAGNDFRFRHYGMETEFYPNYVHNLLYSGLQYTSGLSTRLSGEYSLGVRRHPNYVDDDYIEHTITASIYQATATNSSIFLHNSYRLRNYAHGGNDSTYQNPFREEYVRGDFRFGMTPSLSFDVQADVTLRQHNFVSFLTPDYLNITANPRFLIRFLGDWQLGLGYIYTLRVYETDIIKTSPTVVNADPNRFALDQSILGYEDYFSHGISISLDLFRLGAFMLNLSNNFEYRSYPNSQTNSISSFPLYSDRQIYNTFLFLSWKVHSQLELGMFANYDQDRSRNQKHSDSRNNLFSLELGYTF